MNARCIAAVLASSLLTACGGGGGGASVTPSQPGGGVAQMVTFSFKVPVKAKQVVRQKMIGGKYVSPATLGLGITFSTTTTTFTAAQLTTPSVAVDLSKCVNTTLGSASVTCTTNSDGSQTFTAMMPLPPATYTFEVVTWDCGPSGSPLAFPGNQLSNALTSVTVTAGASVPSPNFVLNAVPASVVLTAVPGQNHVSGIGSYSITGNAAQQFFLNALDADGFIITGSGAPTLSLSDSTGSFALSQNTSNPNVTNEWSIEALQAALQNTGGVSVVLNATAPGAALPVTSKTTIVPVPEMWMTIGSSSIVQGYAMTVANGAASIATAPLDAFLSTASGGPIVADNAGNIWVVQGSNVQEYNAPSWSSAPTVNSNFFQDPCSGTPSGLALDASGYIVIADPSCNGGSISAYKPAALGAALYQISAKVNAQSGLSGAASVSLAPNASAVQSSSLQNDLFVNSNNGSNFSIDILTPTASAVTDAYPGAVNSGASGPSVGIGIAPNGNAWYYDGANLNVAALISGGINKSVLASTPITTTASQFAADPMGSIWIPVRSGTSPIYYYLEQFTLSGSTITIGANRNVPNPVTGVYIAP